MRDESVSIKCPGGKQRLKDMAEVCDVHLVGWVGFFHKGAWEAEVFLGEGAIFSCAELWNWLRQGRKRQR